jgi:rhodanese-related sulfurtransferase
MDVMHSGLPVATARQTSLGLYATAREAYDMWKADPQAVRLLDVRSPEEYVFIGHAPMARLIPMAVPTYAWDPTGTALPWAPNPDFVPTVAQWAGKQDTILVTCRSGGRSAMAINTLAGAGFTRLYNVLDGMEGGLVDDPSSVFHGLRMKNGWRNGGLPWTYDLTPSQMTLPTRGR